MVPLRTSSVQRRHEQKLTREHMAYKAYERGDSSYAERQGLRLLKKTKNIYFRVIVALSVMNITSQMALPQQTKMPFTVAEDIALTTFASPYGPSAKVRFSPDGNYFAVWSERGRLDLNCVEDSLRFYRRQDVEAFLKRSDASQSVKPVWIVNRSDKEGTVINDWRWLPDSRGVVYLEGAYEFTDKQLMLADVRRKVVEPLTSTT